MNQRAMSLILLDCLQDPLDTRFIDTAAARTWPTGESINSVRNMLPYWRYNKRRAISDRVRI
jgi:hypothetical protein